MSFEKVIGLQLEHSKLLLVVPSSQVMALDPCLNVTPEFLAYKLGIPKWRLLFPFRRSEYFWEKYHRKFIDNINTFLPTLMNDNKDSLHHFINFQESIKSLM